jgi:hypothetical protein
MSTRTLPGGRIGRISTTSGRGYAPPTARGVIRRRWLTTSERLRTPVRSTRRSNVASLRSPSSSRSSSRSGSRSTPPPVQGAATSPCCSSVGTARCGGQRSRRSAGSMSRSTATAQRSDWPERRPRRITPWSCGSDWLWDGDEPPVSLKDRETGEVIRPLVVDEATGQPLELATSAWAATRIIERAGGSLRGSRVWSAIGNWRSPT